jgi:hypothetical protein
MGIGRRMLTAPSASFADGRRLLIAPAPIVFAPEFRPHLGQSVAMAPDWSLKRPVQKCPKRHH